MTDKEKIEILETENGSLKRDIQVLTDSFEKLFGSCKTLMEYVLENIKHKEDII